MNYWISVLWQLISCSIFWPWHIIVHQRLRCSIWIISESLRDTWLYRVGIFNSTIDRSEIKVFKSQSSWPIRIRSSWKPLLTIDRRILRSRILLFPHSYKTFTFLVIWFDFQIVASISSAKGFEWKQFDFFLSTNKRIPVMMYALSIEHRQRMSRWKGTRPRIIIISSLRVKSGWVKKFSLKRNTTFRECWVDFFRQKKAWYHCWF